MTRDKSADMLEFSLDVLEGRGNDSLLGSVFRKGEMRPCAVVIGGVLLVGTGVRAAAWSRRRGARLT